jgi:hypothetical protein
MRYGLLIPVIIIAASGCATIQAAETRSTERLLSAAGFHTEPADTSEKLAELQTLPAREVLPQTRDGKATYVYPDPAVCHCLYVGGETEYQDYQRLRQRNIADERARANATSDFLDPWGLWW